MTDVRLIQRTGNTDAFEAVTLDLLLTAAHDLDTEQELATAVTVALMTDALILEDDQPPDGGWWGDLDALEIWDGWPFGAKLRKFKRAKITGVRAAQGATTAKIEAYVREALQPFIDRKIASRIDVLVARAGSDRVEASIVLYRGGRDAIALRFADLWNGVLVSAPTA